MDTHALVARPCAVPGDGWRNHPHGVAWLLAAGAVEEINVPAAPPSQSRRSLAVPVAVLPHPAAASFPLTTDSSAYIVGLPLLAAPAETELKEGGTSIYLSLPQNNAGGGGCCCFVLY